MVRRWVARVIATYRSWPPAGDWSRIPAGSASTTRSNSRPLAWPTVSSATGESSTSARSPGTAAGSAWASSAIRLPGAMTASRPPSLHLGELFLHHAGDGGETLDRARRHALLADGLGRALAGATAASTSAASAMISVGVR